MPLTISSAFTPVNSLLGGLMMASSVHYMLLKLGSVLGISGFFHSVVSGASDQTARYFTAGLLIGGAVLSALQPQLGVPLFDSPAMVPKSTLFTLAAGALVGLGTKLGSGCTSGHFLCGLSRLSPRSIVATATFFSVAVATHLRLFPSSITSTPLKDLTSIVLPDWKTVALLQAPALIYARKKQGAKLSSFTIGMHFAFALGLSGMLCPSKVLGFLAMSPSTIWDPSLAMVAIGGILPASYGYFAQVKPRMKKSAKPLQVTEWRLPAQPGRIDARLIVGGVLFGLGWGATGLCPGPALVSLASGKSELIPFVAAMTAGGQIASYL